MAKKQQAKAQEQKITAKTVGRNVIINIQGKKLSRAFANKEDRDKILADVEALNKKSTKTGITALVKAMEGATKERVTKQAKEKVKAVKVEKKAVEPKEIKQKVSKPTVEESKKVLQDAEYTVAKSAPRTRTGEH